MGVTEPQRGAAIEELLGAYALDACDPREVELVDAYLERDPAAAEEAARLATAAAWIGAGEALAPPLGLRDAVLEAAFAHRPARAEDGALTVFEHEADRLDALCDTLAPSELGAMTATGLRVRDLVAHLAAMESMIAAGMGDTAASLVASNDVEERTVEFVAAFGDRPLDEARAVWRRSVEVTRRWARSGGTSAVVPWLGVAVDRETLLVGRAFEWWTHADDIRRALGRPLAPPAPPDLHVMADLSIRMLGSALALTGRQHPGRTARIALTGAGGGTWLVALGAALDDRGAARQPDVAVRAEVVAWCRRVAERISPDALEVVVDGDRDLATDLVTAASAFATL